MPTASTSATPLKSTPAKSKRSAAIGKGKTKVMHCFPFPPVPSLGFDQHVSATWPNYQQEPELSSIVEKFMTHKNCKYSYHHGGFPVIYTPFSPQSPHVCTFPVLLMPQMPSALTPSKMVLRQYFDMAAYLFTLSLLHA